MSHTQMAQPRLSACRAQNCKGCRRGGGGHRLMCAPPLPPPLHLLQSLADQYLPDYLPKACPIVAKARLRLHGPGQGRVRVRDRVSGGLGLG